MSVRRDRRDRRDRRERRGERGAALFVAMMMLALVAVLGLASLDTAMLDQQVAGFQRRKRAAFNAAEAGSAAARAALGAGVPTILTGDIGDSADYPYGRPSFRPNPDVASPIEWLGGVAAGGMNLKLGSNSGTRYQIQFWRFRVEGQSAGGARTRIDTAVGVFVGN